MSHPSSLAQQLALSVTEEMHARDVELHEALGELTRIKDILLSLHKGVYTAGDIYRCGKIGCDVLFISRSTNNCRNCGRARCAAHAEELLTQCLSCLWYFCTMKCKCGCK